MPISVSTETKDNRLVVTVDGELTIFEAANGKPELLNALRMHSQRDVEVDLSRVLEIDTSGVQLMLMLKREAQLLEKSLTFTHHSAPVLSVIDLLNLASNLGDPLLISAHHGT